ncbi:MAG: NADPH:quinone oxidoreductase family protein [Acidobacteriia bacterium]|nr:NADPH:quinone oxidoreductase family protein [Methyloceanibacter sp.]MCL6492893.1 NADPH:quinone oxidoreductase family protein [Terriglobia bacterium]
MKAIVCENWGGPELLKLRDLPSPVPGPGEVKIAIRAAGINFPDLLIIQKKYQHQPPLPFTPGAEVAGEVVALGPGVSDLRVGDRVLAACSTGGFAEEVTVKAEKCIVIPPNVAFDVAAAFTLAYATGWHALMDRGELKPGETVLVLGAGGGVGLAAVEVAKAAGARVVAAASSEEKLAVCRAHGADETINYSEEDLRAGIARTTANRGPDVIYDPVGGKYAEPAFRSIAWRGRYLVIGFASGAIPSLALNLPLLKGASIVGVLWGAFAQREPERHKEGMRTLLAWLAEGKLKPLISHRYRLAEVPQALADMAARKIIGKTVMVP